MTSKNFELDTEIARKDILARRPIRYKVLAVVVALFFSIGSHFASNTLNTNKKEIKKHLAFNNTQYGVVQSAMYLINTIMPLFGGVLMDRFGTGYGAVLSNSVILLGNVFILIGSYCDKGLSSYSMVVTGRFLHGIGSGVIVIAQQAILSKWFSTSYLGIIIGIQIGASRFSNFCAQRYTPLIAEKWGVSAAFLSSVIACFISFVASLLYVFVLHRAGGEKGTTKYSKKRFSYRRLMYLPLGFWILPFTYMVIASTSKTFMSAVNEYISLKYAEATVKSAKKSSLILLIGIFLAPAQGFFLDYVGKRSYIIMLSVLFLIASFAMFWKTYGELELYVAMSMFAIGKCIGPVATLSSVAIMLPPELVATGLGAGKSLANIGIGLMHILIGIVQDASPNQDYSKVIPMILCVSCISFFLTLFYFYYNWRIMHNLFDAPMKHRQAIIDKYSKDLIVNRSIDELDEPNLGQYIFLGLAGLFLLVSWILFLVCLVCSDCITKKALIK